MQQLRQAAARERRAPIYWWLLLMGASGGALVWLVYGRSPPGAFFVAMLLAAAWAAPLVALRSLAAPPRAKKPAPAPGTGSFADWLAQARMLGRVLLYYQDNPELPPDLQREIRAAREDLRDVLRAHPLRDDLERVCGRVRAGAIRSVKDWFAREYRRDIRELANEYEQEAAAGMDADKRMLALRQAVEKAAALMSRNCMPRMLERERLACAVDCAWLAVQGVVAGPEHVSPVDLVEMLVIEWSDFSEPWQPATALRRALARLDRADARPAPPPPAAPAEDPAVVVRNGKRYRRVRVRRQRRRPHRHFWNRGPSLADVILSFGQWVRYSIRAWMLYR
ncbi:MAG: hypothetical protein AB7V22_00895 [Kiritimatiellia bacterium]